jgi:sulfoxide reductase heme-binding subunit YedZ
MALKKDYWRRRATRHFVLAAAAFVITWLAFRQIPPADFRHRVSMSTAYSSLAFLAVSLCLGPWNVLRRKPNPVSFDLRRDIGIWAALLAILHTGFGLTVHLRGRMWMYFFKSLHPLAIQKSTFGFANYVGLAAALLFAMLLAISNDFSIRSLGSRGWKSVQRWTYAAFGLTVAHGIAFQIVEKRRAPWVLIFVAMGTVVIAFQLLGFAYKRRNARGPSALGN